MIDNVTHFENKETITNKDEIELTDAYTKGFFNTPENVAEVADQLAKDKETYKKTLDTFFKIDSDAHLGKEHRKRFDDHLPISGMVLEKLGKGNEAIFIGNTTIKIDNTPQSLQFIRGIIKATEKEYTTGETSINNLLSTENRNSILLNYQNEVNEFLDKYNTPFNTILYIREQDDNIVFKNKTEHRNLYTSRGKELQEYIPGKDFTDGASVVQKIRAYCEQHPGEKTLLYLGGHGGKDGSMFFNLGKKGVISHQDFLELSAIPGLTLDIDSCYTGNKLQDTNPKSAGIFANSEFDTSKVAYDICLFESKSRKFDMRALKEKYPNLKEIQERYNRNDSDIDFISDHLTEKNLGFLFTLDSYDIHMGDDPNNTLSLSSLHRTGINSTIQSLNDLIDKTGDPASQDITCTSKENPNTSIKIPLVFLRDVMQLVTYQHGDYNNDGEVSYGEARIYALQYYKQGFLPTTDLRNGEYIEISEYNSETANESDGPYNEIISKTS